jgi:outer membrane immunogenic protein
MQRAIKQILLMGAFALATGGQSLAADIYLPQRAPVPYVAAIPPVYNWSGIYIGGNAGVAWNQGSVTDSINGLTFSNNSNNAVFIGGGQVGGNWQIGALVFGVEGDFDWLANQNNSNAGTAVPSLGGNVVQVISNDRWLTMLTGRVGYAADRWLFYGKGGGAWVGNQSFTVNNTSTGASFTSSNGGWNSGWTVGAGIELAFAGSWSVKAEYDFIGLANKSFAVPAGAPFLAGDTFTTSNRDIQMGLVGVNYKFGPWW